MYIVDFVKSLFVMAKLHKCVSVSGKFIEIQHIVTISFSFSISRNKQASYRSDFKPVDCFVLFGLVSSTCYT